MAAISAPSSVEGPHAQPGDLSVARGDRPGVEGPQALPADRGLLKPSLQALTAAALALPGLAAAAEFQADYLYGHYQEADIGAANTASGEAAERYRIDSHLFRLTAPAGDTALALDLTYESMSGASPWWVQPDVDGRPVQIMSGASIRENRIDAQLGWTLPLGGTQLRLLGGYSHEDDYEALNGGVEVAWAPEGQQWSLNAGLGYSDDHLEPTDAETTYPERVDEADRDSLSAYGGLSLILGPQTQLQLSASFAEASGFLTDPYKRAFFQSGLGAAGVGTLPESRPDGRRSWTTSLRLRQYYSGLGAALHADYRYYGDDWEIESHTLDLAWHQALGKGFRVVPGLRAYSQSQAYFYAPYYAAPRADGFASSDYRLSPYGALSARLDLRKAFGPVELGVGGEWYRADASYALGSVALANPGLVEYTTLSLRLAWRY